MRARRLRIWMSRALTLGTEAPSFGCHRVPCLRVLARGYVPDFGSSHTIARAHHVLMHDSTRIACVGMTAMCHINDVRRDVASHCYQRSSSEALAALQARRIASGVVRSVAQLYDEEIALGSDVVSHVALANGGAAAPVPAPAFRTAPPGEVPRVSGLGRDTEEVLRGLGVGNDELQRLAGEGVIPGDLSRASEVADA